MAWLAAGTAWCWAVGVGLAAEPLATLPWPALDGLGRRVALSAETGPPRPERFVGIFYFLWHQHAGGAAPDGEGPYDIAKILARDPQALAKPDSPLWGPVGQYHYWGEPLYGYYRSDDPWVLRRHAQALADAGVDTLIFDTTNAVTYDDVYLKLCEVFAAIRAEGGTTPQICFMTNTRAGETAERIYRTLYAPGKHRDLWFHWLGKPLMICDPAEASEELRAFFTLRRAHWPFTMENTERAWHWEATYPQPYGYLDDPHRPEQANVSVAQNLRRSDGKVTNMSDGDARGRSFHQGDVDRTPGAIDRGLNFAEQWERAYELDPPFVMVTGWNEWIAGRFSRPEKPIVFVDQFDQEHSRDIEYAKVGHLDHYYWQMVSAIRRYKGTPPLPAASPPQTIDLEQGFAAWNDVQPEFLDTLGETAQRDHPGQGGVHYVNRTGRHDLASAKVARNADHVYFYLKTVAPIASAADLAGLWLRIDCDPEAETGWEGFDLRVGSRDARDGRWALERYQGEGRWKTIAVVPAAVSGHELHVALPRSALGAAAERAEAADFPLTIDFQWVDNPQSLDDPLDAHVSGDAAPNGRFRYRYVAP
jgi:hypothetical protein